MGIGLALITSRLRRAAIVPLVVSLSSCHTSPPHPKANHARAAPARAAQTASETCDLAVLVVLDGVRWQEVFHGVDSSSRLPRICRVRKSPGRATALDATNSKAWITLGAARQALGDQAGGREAYQACVDQGQGRFVSDCRMMLR